MIEPFLRTHRFLVEHSHPAVRRSLMDSIDWSYRLIGIRGPRGVGRTSFLLHYAKEKFDPQLNQCIYINSNNFYFHGRGLDDFVREFVNVGGQVLIIDQAFKLPNWKDQLMQIYHKYPFLRIVYSTTSVNGDEKDQQHELDHIAHTYVLHGFSFREYINQQTGTELGTYTLNEILSDTDRILKTILPKVRPSEHFQNYLHHGYYPFYLENRNFTEALLKAMNNMVEVDVLLRKQIELSYLSKIKKLLYLLAAQGEDNAPNISELADELGTSRATIMNYLKYLEEARLINMVYREGNEFPKKPAAVFLHDTNYIYGIQAPGITDQLVMETFLVNVLWRHHTINQTRRNGIYQIDNRIKICVCDKNKRIKVDPDLYYAKYNTEIGYGKEIPIWLFGFLY